MFGKLWPAFLIQILALFKLVVHGWDTKQNLSWEPSLLCFPAFWEALKFKMIAKICSMFYQTILILLQNDLLRALGQKHQIYEFLSSLSLKCSYLLFNKEHIKELILEAGVLKSSGSTELILSSMSILVVWHYSLSLSSTLILNGEIYSIDTVWCLFHFFLSWHFTIHETNLYFQSTLPISQWRYMCFPVDVFFPNITPSDDYLWQNI